MVTKGHKTTYAPVNFTALCHLEPKKVSIHGPNPPRIENCPPEKIMHGAVKFTGT